MKDLTPRQAEVLAFIREFIAQHGMPPTRQEIASHFQWGSANAAEEHLQTLRRKGAIFLVRGIARGIQLASREAP